MEKLSIKGRGNFSLKQVIDRSDNIIKKLDNVLLVLEKTRLSLSVNNNEDKMVVCKGEHTKWQT